MDRWIVMLRCWSFFIFRLKLLCVCFLGHSVFWDEIETIVDFIVWTLCCAVLPFLKGKFTTYCIDEVQQWALPDLSTDAIAMMSVNTFLNARHFLLLFTHLLVALSGFWAKSDLFSHKIFREWICKVPMFWILVILFVCAVWAIHISWSKCRLSVSLSGC